MAKALDRGLESREIVPDILTEALEQGTFVHLVLNQALQKYQYLGKADRLSITRAVGGTLEYLIQIDKVINRYSKTKINKMKPFIRSLLRVGAYQVLYMGHMPNPTVCNETVKVAVKRHSSRLRGFVSGVLWTIPRKEENLTSDAPSLRHSIPERMYAMWEKESGKEKAKRIAASFLEDKPAWIRCNLHRVDRESILASLKTQGTSVRELPLVESMIAIDKCNCLEGLDAFRKGWIQVQDATSAFMEETASPEKDSYIIDVCATPGGKNLHLADKLEGTGVVEARDFTYQKTTLVEENAAHCGVTSMETLVWNALETDLSAMAKADIVIVNLPCSDLGVIGRKPDIKYNITPEKFEELAGLRREILSAAWQYVRLGSLLCRNTHTTDRLENRGNVVWLRDRFSLVPVDLTDRFGGLPQEPSLKDGWIQLLPGVYPYDGSFINVLRRAEDETDPEGIQSVFWKEFLCQVYQTVTERKI